MFVAHGIDGVVGVDVAVGVTCATKRRQVDEDDDDDDGVDDDDVRRKR